MKLPHLLLSALCASAALASSAPADEFIGGILDRSGGSLGAFFTAGAGAIEAPNRPDPSDVRDHEKLPYYGQGHVRLELGTGVGINGDVRLGRELIDVSKPGLLGFRAGSSRFALHAGLEGSMHFNANTDDDRSEYGEVMPMLSLGLQATQGSCHALAAARAGGALGTLGANGLRPAYGAEGSIVCKGVKAAGEWTRISSDGDSANIGSLDFKKVRIGNTRNSFWGVRGEMINTRTERALPDAGAQDRNEYRILFTAGTAAL
jgi:hypothetical protein